MLICRYVMHCVDINMNLLAYVLNVVLVLN